MTRLINVLGRVNLRVDTFDPYIFLFIYFYLVAGILPFWFGYKNKMTLNVFMGCVVSTRHGTFI
jgi:hypothetical protein